MAGKRRASQVGYVYFVHKQGGGVARVSATPDNKKVLAIYRADPCWREVKQATYRDERFKLCLV